MRAIVGWSPLVVAGILSVALLPTASAVADPHLADVMPNTVIQSTQTPDNLSIVQSPMALDHNDQGPSAFPASPTSAPTPPAFQPANDPLPPAFWPGLTMLGIVAATLALRRARRRTA